MIANTFMTTAETQHDPDAQDPTSPSAPVEVKAAARPAPRRSINDMMTAFREVRTKVRNEGEADFVLDRIAGAEGPGSLRHDVAQADENRQS